MTNIYDAPKSEQKQPHFSDCPRDLELIDWLFSFKGRLSRKQFWLFYGPYILTFGLGVVDLKIPFALSILVIWPLMAVQVKRWHDLDKTGWWSLLWFVPFVGWLLVLLDAGINRGSKFENKYGASLYKSI